jgi:hypothetical protein
MTAIHSQAGKEVMYKKFGLFTYLSEPDAEPEPDLEADFDDALLLDSLSEPEPVFLSESDPDSWPDSSPDTA